MTGGSDTICVTCGKGAPLMGDGGFLGYPSLSRGPHEHHLLGSVPGFGYFYRALEGIHLVTAETARYHQFLVQHDGHVVHLGFENDDESKDAPLGYPEAAEAAMQDVDEAVEEQGTIPEGFVIGTITYHCEPCGAKHSSSDPDALRIADHAPVSPEAAEAAAEWLDADELQGEWSYGLAGVLDAFEPFLYQLAEFLRVHGAHGVVAIVQEASDS